jgi:hypothetical protein
MPDERVSGDTLWIGRIATTRCIQPPPPASSSERQLLMAWLKAAARERPVLVHASAEATPEAARIQVNMVEGSLLLVPVPVPGGGEDPRQPQRLVFQKRTPGAHSVPAGRWRVAGYRRQQLAEDQTLWQAWAAGRHGRVLELKQGEVFALHLDEHVGARVQWSIKGERFQGSVAVTGDSGLGLSLMAGKERVPARMVLKKGATVLDAVPLDWG